MPLIQEPDAKYHARKEISNSMLGKLDPPYRFYAHHEAENPIETKQTDAKDEGAAMHMMLLQPGDFDDRFAVAPDVDRRTKIGKLAWADFVLENAGKTVIKKAQFDRCADMAEAVFREPTAADLLRRAGLHETTVLWHDDRHDLDCRARLDKIIPADGILIDIKRSRSAAPRGFQRAIVDYSYHRQAMYYCDGLAQSGEKQYEGARDWPFVWIVIEPEPPYCVGLYTMDDDQRERGRFLYNAGLLSITNCRQANHWPHYTNGVEVLHLPEWAYKDFDPTEVIA